MTNHGPVVSLLLLLVLRACAASVSPREVCFRHVAGSQLLYQGRQSSVNECVNDLDTIVCEADCSGTDREIDVFAVHDPSCRHIDRVSLTLMRMYHDDIGNVVLPAEGETNATFQPFTSRWLEIVRFCPYREMHYAELNMKAEPLVDCRLGRMTYTFNVTLYNDIMEPVTCGDDSLYFFSPLPVN